MKLLTFIVCFTFLTGLTAQQKVNLNTQAKNDISIVSSGTSGMELLVTTNDFALETAKTKQGYFFRMNMADAYTTGINGQAALPVLSHFIQVPEDASVEVKVLSSTYQDVNLNDYSIGHYKLMPFQPSVSKSQKGEIPFYFDQQYYQRNQFDATEEASVSIEGHMRNIRLGRLTISPFSYNPATNTLRVYTAIRVKISFTGANLAKTSDLAARYQNYDFSSVSQSILNAAAFSSKDTRTQYPVKYVIVADPMFQSALQPFVAWKTKKGFKVVEAYTNNAAVGNTTTSIKAYLKNMYDNATPSDPAQSFVLIVGDVAQVPAFNGTAGSHVTDMYYAEYTGDIIPEVYFGRFSATSVAELQPQIDKTLEYEQYLFPTENWLDTVVMIGGVDGTFGPTHANGQITYGTTYYFNAAHGLYSYTHLYPNSGNEDAQIKSQIGKGVSFANYTAHGYEEGWADPSFDASEIASMNNAHKYPLMIGNACLTNSFQVAACFGEALLRANLKGAIGYIGGSNSTYWDEDFYWGVGLRSTINTSATYDAAHLGAYDRTWHINGEPFSDWYVSQGQMILAGNLAVFESTSSLKTYYSEIYHLMGDPSLMVYFGVPTQLTVNHPALVPLGQTTIAVTTEPYAYVGISQGGVWHGAGIADASGNLTINIIPFTTPGSVDIVGTKQNRKPYISTLMAQTPSGPYVIYETKTINDVLGNNNQQADFTETVDLNVTLKNYGVAVANAVTATISTSDSYVTILDNSGTWGQINANESKVLNQAFRIKVDTLIPDQHVVNFDLSIQDNGGNTWTSTFTVTLNAPVLEIQTLSINDASGNNNNRLDPGETATLGISVINSGHAKVDPVNALLSTASANLTINSASFSHGELAVNVGETGTYNVTVSSAAVNGSTVFITLNLNGMQYTASKTFTISVGQVDEDWESGDLTAFDWTTGGNAPWTITSGSPYEGSFSAKSGSISDDQTSTLSVVMDVLANDTISFYRKVSSESGYDFLKFKIDGAQKDEWSGEIAWSSVAYPVSTGQRTFTWSYEKDYSQSEGSDAAWVDYIVFPPVGTPESISETPDFTFGLFPNPATDQLRVELAPAQAANYTISLTNAEGKLVRMFYTGEIKAGKQSLKFDITGIAPGTYFINVKGENGNSSRMIIKN